jgi:uncharacterized protein (TIGR03437 family)
MSKTIFLFSTALLVASAIQAQNFDTSGTAGLHGAYLFRYVTFFNDSNGNVTESCSLTGTINFNGTGNYTISSSAQLFDSAGAGQGGCASLGAGTYGVQSNGIAQLDNPMFATTLFGSFTSPVVMASSTEDDFWDLFIAVQAPTSGSNNLLSGTFTVGTMDFLNADITLARQGFFTLKADGGGNIAAFTLTGSEANNVATQLTQSVAASTYSLSGSSGGTITFPGSSMDQVQIVAGQKTLFVSADGNYIVGGSTTGSDIYFGFRAPTASASNALLNGTYLMAGIDAAIGGLSGGGNFLDGFYGSINTNGSGQMIWHQRLQDVVDVFTFDNTFNVPVTIGSNGSFYDGSTFNYLVGANGGAMLVIGSGSQFSFEVALQAPSVTPTTNVWINPIGITNAANFTPITNAYAPGELVDIFGTFNVASNVDTMLPIPTILSGVQVTVNGIPAPVYAVSQNEITIIIPYEVAGQFFLTFQVNINNSLSNRVTVYADNSGPGIYTLGQNGLGAGAILHSNFTVVNDSSPARPGETVLLFMNGLGTVTPSVVDGAVGGTNPLSNSDEFTAGGLNVILIDAAGNQAAATVQFAGLAPCCAGLYQVNFTLPSARSISSGDAVVGFLTIEAQNTMSTIAVSGFTGAAIPAAESARATTQRHVRSAIATPRPRGLQSHRRALPERVLAH